MRALTSQPSFAKMCHRNTRPVILMQYCTFRYMNLSFIDKKIKNQIRRVSTSFIKGIEDHYLELWGCCDGLLLFVAKSSSIVGHLFNPILQEHVSFRPPVTVGNICGFYCHPLTSQHMILFSYGKEGSQAVYLMLSLEEMICRPIGSLPYLPQLAYPRTNLLVNKFLLWIVAGRPHRTRALLAPCHESIMAFDTCTQKFYLMAHPGNACNLRSLHKNMQLMEIEGQVTCCVFNHWLLHVWVLKDSTNWTWIRKYKVDLFQALNLQKFLRNSPFELKDSFCDIHCGSALGSELFLVITTIRFFKYDLKTNKATQISMEGITTSIFTINFFFAHYVRSFVSPNRIAWANRPHHHIVSV